MCHEKSPLHSLQKFYPETLCAPGISLVSIWLVLLFPLENIERFLCLDNTSYNYSNFCRYLTRGVRERHSIKSRVLESEMSTHVMRPPTIAAP